MMKKVALLSVIALAAFLANAQIINIPSDFPTIQQGIDAVGEGDTILVQPGTYVENILIEDKNITLASLMLTTSDTAYISQTIIDGNENGSVVSINNVDSTFLICGFTITNGRAAYGGGIYCHDAFPQMEWLDVISNTAVQYSGKRGGGYGGGIYVESYTDTIDSGIRLKNSKIRNNRVTGISGGYPMGIGGGISVQSNEVWISIQLYDVLISGNESASGGGLAIDGHITIPFGTFILSNVSIQNNSAVEYGGGLSIGSSGYPNGSVWGSEWTDVSIAGNSAACGGGIAIGQYSANDSYFQPLVLENISVENNHATEAGGGIFIGQWAAMIVEPRELLGHISNLNNIHIMNNTCDMDGGGIYCEGYLEIDGSDSSFSNIRIQGNMAQGNGGGILIDGKDYAVGCTLNAINISGNHALNGGGMYLNNTIADFSNLCITENVADSIAGGIFKYRKAGNIVNSTIADNTANNGGGGIYWLQPEYAALKMLNCILWNDQPDEIMGDYSTNTLSVMFSSVEGSWPCEGNIDQDPLFTITGSHPYELLAGSPCIDAGIPDTTELSLPSWDILGNYRFWDGDFDNDTIVDMGAYEFGSVGVGFEQFKVQSSKFKVEVFPNPFSEIVHFEFEIRNPSPLEIQVFNALGERVAGPTNCIMPKGQHVEIWNAAELPAGLYFCRVLSGDEIATKKIIKY